MANFSSQSWIQHPIGEKSIIDSVVKLIKEGSFASLGMSFGKRNLSINLSSINRILEAIYNNRAQ
jgi:hypothetical protein